MSAHRRPSGGVPSGPPPGADPARADHPGLIAQAPAILYIADPGADGRWYYVSPQIEAILGFTAVQWCAQPRRWAEHLHPDDVERVIAEEIAAAGDEHEETSATECRLRDRDGRVGAGLV
jgi:PAS domain-containing protein